MEFRHEFSVRAPLERVSSFHSDSSALKVLSPPLPKMRLIKAEPVAEGSITEFEISMGPIRIPWLAEHKDVSFPNGFVDRQLDGPFKEWSHKHQFVPITQDDTRVIDSIQAEYGNIFSRIMWMLLPGLFAFRARATRKTLEQ